MELKNIPVIDCGEFILRPVKKTDAHDLFDYGSDTLVTDFMPWGPFRSIEEVEQVIQTVFLDRPKRNQPVAYAIEWKQNNKMIGTCDFHSVDFSNKRGEVGFCLNRDYWNKGIMTKAVKEIIKFGFEYLSLKRVQVIHPLNNKRAQRVIEKTGFNKEGILKRYWNIKGKQHDVIMYSITKK